MTKIPRPGEPVRGRTRPADHGAARPAGPALGAPRDLGAPQEPLSFRQTQARCGAISSSVLNDRLTELRAAGIVAGGGAGYRLTAEGRELLAVYGPLDAWAERWADRERGVS